MVGPLLRDCQTLDPDQEREKPQNSSSNAVKLLEHHLADPDAQVMPEKIPGVALVKPNRVFDVDESFTAALYLQARAANLLVPGCTRRQRRQARETFDNAQPQDVKEMVKKMLEREAKLEGPDYDEYAENCYTGFLNYIRGTVLKIPIDVRKSALAHRVLSKLKWFKESDEPDRRRKLAEALFHSVCQQLDVAAAREEIARESYIMMYIRLKRPALIREIQKASEPFRRNKAALIKKGYEWGAEQEKNYKAERVEVRAFRMAVRGQVEETIEEVVLSISSTLNECEIALSFLHKHGYVIHQHCTGRGTPNKGNYKMLLAKAGSQINRIAAHLGCDFSNPVTSEVDPEVEGKKREEKVVKLRRYLLNLDEEEEADQEDGAVRLTTLVMKVIVTVSLAMKVVWTRRVRTKGIGHDNGNKARKVNASSKSVMPPSALFDSDTEEGELSEPEPADVTDRNPYSDEEAENESRKTHRTSTHGSHGIPTHGTWKPLKCLGAGSTRDNTFIRLGDVESHNIPVDPQTHRPYTDSKQPEPSKEAEPSEIPNAVKVKQYRPQPALRSSQKSSRRSAPKIQKRQEENRQHAYTEYWTDRFGYTERIRVSPKEYHRRWHPVKGQYVLAKMGWRAAPFGIRSVDGDLLQLYRNAAYHNRINSPDSTWPNPDDLDGMNAETFLTVNIFLFCMIELSNVGEVGGIDGRAARLRNFKRLCTHIGVWLKNFSFARRTSDMFTQDDLQKGRKTMYKSWFTAFLILGLERASSHVNATYRRFDPTKGVTYTMVCITNYIHGSPWGAFSCLNSNYGWPAGYHVDKNDSHRAYCCVIPIGNFTGCCLHLPQLGLMLKIAPGFRHSLVFFTDHQLTKPIMRALAKVKPSERVVMSGLGLRRATEHDTWWEEKDGE
ncbi:hypothetical protein HK097_004259 [Rhizophlyctis rosea]|uniref:Uncharacterized protein n=1 Tax=Rhizophlyctis rosea TaxID=64517 RepID=A0AAD5SF00_9FUNG|nr:hypothetical protein HK097_004259 [Rhizophlyctis rosea]